jgi:hypothetical protein
MVPESATVGRPRELIAQAQPKNRTIGALPSVSAGASENAAGLKYRLSVGCFAGDT